MIIPSERVPVVISLVVGGGWQACNKHPAVRAMWKENHIIRSQRSKDKIGRTFPQITSITGSGLIACK